MIKPQKRHIIGKVYDINAHNMNKLIAELDEFHTAYDKMAEDRQHFWEICLKRASEVAILNAKLKIADEIVKQSTGNSLDEVISQGIKEALEEKIIGRSINVIEKSAYDDALRELESLKEEIANSNKFAQDQEDKLAVAVKALEKQCECNYYLKYDKDNCPACKAIEKIKD